MQKSSDYKLSQESNIQELEQEIATKEKIVTQIRKSIKTEKYKNVDSSYMHNIGFC